MSPSSVPTGHMTLQYHLPLRTTRKTISPEKAMEKRNEASKEVLRQILNRAIADPKFRAQVFKNPELALAKLKLPKDQIQSISANFDKRMKRQIDAIDELINMLSAEVLCTGGGGCGIA